MMLTYEIFVKEILPLNLSKPPKMKENVEKLKESTQFG